MRNLCRLAAAPVIGLALLSFALVGCDDGCGEGESSQVVGHHTVWHPSSTTVVNGKTVTHPGYSSYITDYQCRPDS